jgi:pimeloyl-ACP methyl ester carboxylesterase
VSQLYKSETAERDIKSRYAAILKYWPVANEHFRIPTREGETFVVACGDRNAPPLLLFHGAMANTTMWMGDVAAWSQHFRVYAIDMIGEPGFSAPSRPSLVSEAHALWLDDVLQGLALTQVCIVGVSLGGWLALDYATRRPGRVQRLVALCPAGVGRQKNFLLKAFPLLLLGSWGRRKMRELVLGRPPNNMTSGQKYFADYMALIFEQFRSRVVSFRLFTNDELKRLTMPLMAIVGGQDVLFDSKATQQRLECHVAQAKVMYLPEVRHLIANQTAPILEFLRNS